MPLCPYTPHPLIKLLTKSLCSLYTVLVQKAVVSGRPKTRDWYPLTLPKLFRIEWGIWKLIWGYMGQPSSMCNSSYREALLFGLMTDPPQHIWMAVTCTQMIVEKQIRGAMDSIVSVLHVKCLRVFIWRHQSRFCVSPLFVSHLDFWPGPPLLTWAWPREERGGPKFWPEFSDFYNIKVTSWLQHRFLAEQWLCAEKNPVIFCLTILDFQAWYCLIWLHCPYIVC